MMTQATCAQNQATVISDICTRQFDIPHRGGLEHINTQIQRRSERQGRTPEFKDSNVNNLVMFNCDH